MSDTDPSGAIEAVRRFNRFYTRQIGVLEESLLRSPFTLTEARILYELAHREETTATDLGRALTLDAGYLSRTIKALQKRRLVSRTPSPSDGRQILISLSADGQRAFAELNSASRAQVGEMLEALPSDERDVLIRSMSQISRILGAEPEERVPYILRPHQPGDLGWVVHRHGVLYSREYGWDNTFEGLVAEIVATFAREFDPKRERCWIAEKDGENVGSVFLVKHHETPEAVAKLRLLLVEPRARGLGIGSRLVTECTRFARQVGYERITLWTNDELVAARHIYEREGYRLVEEEPHQSFGHDLIGQTWELEL